MRQNVLVEDEALLMVLKRGAVLHVDDERWVFINDPTSFLTEQNRIQVSQCDSNVACPNARGVIVQPQATNRLVALPQ